MNERHSPRPHLLVRASAGSGKTYQLVRRLIGLLADEETPETILAATFSRKAAGEFRSKLLSTVAEAVADPQKTAALAADIGHPEYGPDTFRQLLGSLVRNPDALRLCTIDAFFLELIGLFRLELGLGTEVKLAAETADDFETRDLLRSIFTAASDEVRQAVFHLVEEDRSGDSLRSFQDVLERWIADALSLYRAAPSPELWGAVPTGMRLPPVSLDEWQTRLASFENELRGQELPPEAVPSIEALLEIFHSWDLSPTLPDGVQRWLTAAATDRQKLLDGKKYFVLNRKRVTLAPETGAALIQLAEIYHAQSLLLAIRNTRGAHAFLAMFEREYENRRLRAGTIRFADLPFLLSSLREFENTALAYRLDASLRHWLLDEFQDTSRSQWQVVEPLIEELFYDTDIYRTFFCVGDPKQAIYGWRQGDSRLFGEIFEQFHRFEPRPLEAATLAKTFRCAPAVVAFVNRLFGASEAFPPDLDRAVVDRWMAGWEHHESARNDLPGRVEVQVAASGEDRDQALLAFLSRERPWEKGHSVAILCRRNKEANRFESLLRSGGIPTIRDGALAIHRDFQVGRILHALFQVLVHPGDTAALTILASGSAAAALRKFVGGDIRPQSIRSRWERGTVDEFLIRLGTCLDNEGWMDESERRCLRVVHAQIRNLDSGEGASLREILRAIRHGRIEDGGHSGSVQILTIHRSKGLEFDFVLLPDLDSKTAPSNFKEFWIKEDHGEVSGILESVRKDVRAAFPPLDEWGSAREQDRAFESLCVQYVALTRAASSLHLFLSEKKGKSKTGIHRWIEQAFEVDAEPGQIISLGEPVEPRPQPPPPEATPEPPPPSRVAAASGGARRLVTPSAGGKSDRIPPFTPGRRRGLALGRRVHEILSLYEWPGNDFAPQDADPEASSLVATALENPDIRALLSPDNPPAEVWRERAFEACIDDVWNSGIFDRVHLPDGWRSGNARPLIIDFKIDRLKKQTIPDNYRYQMNLYRKALARILALPEKQIEAKLLFLRDAIIHKVE